ncbi:BppU family phage baseplate upper protein [Enterococcus dongliensis]|uniref:BppU family phage baseplate upper protein n=1 Tax=Enterococcus dongliensis TaxID=2559925 RepID=UPI00289079FA|nr:BppU family phage baseplate upper protein [Enterococcus dongliensis]MDT2640454.1 BppU family phage baseplate upper protein [Enterococcus dongliensis]
MANEKQAKFIIDVSAEKKRTRNSTVRFFSKDRQTAKLLIQAEKDKIAISKNLISRVEILLESVNASYIPDGKVIYNDSMTIESDGLFSYTLTDELLNYSGLMAFEIYIYYLSGEQSDSSNRIIYEQRVSAIDRNAGQVELVYLKDMEAAKREVALAAAETITNITGFYSGLDTYSEEKKDEMDAFSTSVGNLASAEKLKIQAELPTVQQISTSETTKIKAELPAVQAVATAEIGKITAVLPTIENAATEVSNYADQKIIEYDAKLEESNQSITTLSQNLSDLKLDMHLSTAYAWSADGTDRFTKVYPGENLALGTALGQKPNLEGKRDVSPSYFLNENGWVCININRDYPFPYYFAGQHSPDKVLSDDFIEKVRGKRLVASALIDFADNLGVPAINVGLSIYYWNDAGQAWKLDKRKTKYESEKVSLDVVIPDNVVNILVAVRGFQTFPAETVIKFSELKLEVANSDIPTPTIYTPSLSEDPINAYPQYRGLALLPSGLPEDYVWEESAERIKQLAQQETDKLKGEVADIQNWIAQQGGTI